MRRRLVLMFAAAVLFAAIVATVNCLVNPYGAFHSELLNPIFRKIQQERLATPYLIRTARPHTVLVGSSRVLLGMPIPQAMRDGVINAALSASTMKQLCALLRLALKQPDLQQIIWGVDFFTFDKNWNRNDPLFNRRTENRFSQKLEDAVISASAFDDSIDCVKRALRGRAKLPPIATASIPWPPALICGDFEARRNAGLAHTGPLSIRHQLTDDVPNYARFEFSQEFFDLFRDTVNLARSHDLRVILFVPPMNQYELEMIRLSGHWDDFQNWKRMLATIGPYVDFSGYNEIAQSDGMFMHLMHFKSAVGETMLRILLEQPLETCGAMPEIVARSAMRVDAASVEDALKKQERMRLAVANDDSRYARMVAMVLAERRGAAGNSATGDFAGEKR